MCVGAALAHVEEHAGIDEMMKTKKQSLFI